MEYQKFIDTLKIFTGVKLIQKINYTIIFFPNKKYNYHISIFKDQWDDYSKITGKNYHLFHVSDNNNSENKCSRYYWIDKFNLKIKKIPKKYFSYHQSSFSIDKSTRIPCEYSNVEKIVHVFQKILDKIFMM